MNGTVTIVLRDRAHLEAHLGDFRVPLETALDWARSRLEESACRSGEERLEFRVPRLVGMTGLATLRPWTRGAFWARRRGRTIPSHLIVGRKRPTWWLCAWGAWQGENTFVLHTLYPGRTAPREIHDPEISVEELPRALGFWTRHAIIVAAGEWDA